MPKISQQAKRLRIYIGEADRVGHKALYQAIVEKAREIDLAGVTVMRGVMGYGADSRIHTAGIIDLSSDLPIVVEIIDSEAYIEALLPYLDMVMKKGMVTIDDVEVMKYGNRRITRPD